MRKKKTLLTGTARPGVDSDDVTGGWDDIDTQPMGFPFSGFTMVFWMQPPVIFVSSTTIFSHKMIVSMPEILIAMEKLDNYYIMSDTNHGGFPK